MSELKMGPLLSRENAVNLIAEALLVILGFAVPSLQPFVIALLFVWIAWLLVFQLPPGHVSWIGWAADSPGQSGGWWTFGTASAHVSTVLGHAKDSDGNYPSDAILQEAARGNVHIEGRSVLHPIDKIGLNTKPRVPIPPSFWAENELEPRCHYADEAIASQVGTKPRPRVLGPTRPDDRQYVDLRVNKTDVLKIWKPKKHGFFRSAVP